MLNRWQRTIVDLRGNVQPFAVIKVRRESDQGAAVIYKDKLGNSVYPNGEVTANANGYAYFYADADLYRIGNAELSIDWRDVDVGSYNATVIAQQALDGSDPVYETLSEMQSDTTQEVPTLGRVVNDGANDGWYVWDGVSWEKTAYQPVHSDDVSVTPEADKIPLANNKGVIKPAWVDGLEYKLDQNLAQLYALRFPDMPVPSFYQEFGHGASKLDPRITFTRSGEATYIKNGRILTAGVDEPVFENGGLRIEPSRTNAVVNSKLGDYWIESAPYYPFNDEEYIIDTTSGFDGHTIRKFSLDKNGYLNIRRRSTNSAYLPTLPTIFVKSNLRYCRVVTSSQLSYSVVYDLQESTVIDIGGSIGFDPSIDSIGDGWRRISMISRPPGGGYISIIEVSSTDNFRDSNNLQTPDDYLMVFGLQQEDGGASLRTTSYIPTAGSTVTRPAEDFWIEDQAFQDIFNPNEGAVLIPHTSYGEGGIIALGSLDIARTDNGLTINNTGIPNTEDAEINLGLRWGSNGIDVFVNGVKELSDVSLPVDWGDTDSLVLADSNGAGKYFNSLSVFTTAPTDSQMEVLTS